MDNAAQRSPKSCVKSGPLGSSQRRWHSTKQVDNLAKRQAAAQKVQSPLGIVQVMQMTLSSQDLEHTLFNSIHEKAVRTNNRGA